MRLFLSSQGITPNQKALLNLVGKKRKTAFINNAKDYGDPKDRYEHTKQKLLDYSLYGLEPVELDLRDYFDSQNSLSNVLRDVGLVWLSGGNTFVLRRALAQSGLDKWLVENVGSGRVAYGGSSAGAIIPTPSLRGTEHGDFPHEIPEGYDEAVVWEGLNLVPFHIVPHYESEWFGDEAAAMEKYMLDSSLSYKVLRDGEAIIINGDQEEVVS